jgi:hypothetical protein
LPRRKRPVRPGKVINLDDHSEMLLDIFRTIEFSPSLVLPKTPASPGRGFLFAEAALIPDGTRKMNEGAHKTRP